MESAFSFGKAFLDERTPARCGRLTRIERLAWLGLRDSTRGAGPLAPDGSLVWPATTSAAAGTLRKSSGRTATGTRRTARSRRTAGARRSTRSCRGAHALRRARSLPLVALAGLRRWTRRRKSLAGWRRARRPRRTGGCPRRRGRSRRRTLCSGSAGLSGSRVRCTTRSRTGSRLTQWHAGSRASRWRGSGWSPGSSRGTRRRNSTRTNGAGSSRRRRGSSSGRRGGGRFRSGSRSRRQGRSARSRRRCSRSRRSSGGCRRARGLFCGSLGSFGSGLRSGEILEMLAHEHGVLDVDRARVRLLFGDADLGQVVDQHLGFDLEFPREFVDPDLISV